MTRSWIRIRAIAGLLIASPLCLWSWPANAGFEDCQEYVVYGLPGPSGDQLCRLGYALAHDPEKKTPIWVAEHITRERAMAQATRKDLFAPDPDLIAGQRAELRDYKGSGFDRGHMAPNADFNWDADAAKESFYLSNMVPQVGKGMNQGIWKELESATRLWAVQRGGVFVYTGPIYEGQFRKIGKGKVAVPTALYKIVYDPATDESVTFIMPNKALKVQDLMNYIATIDDVETRTGLSFLSAIPEDRRQTIKRAKATVTWK
ncbi:MAG: non-specific endonuclease [Ramlibacter sp.]|nr:non-specific endonuclease [Ramlibacter sp.]